MRAGAYLVVCNKVSLYTSHPTQHDQERTFFFEELRVWIAVDPVSPSEHVILDAKPGSLDVLVGADVLKSFTMAR